MLHYDTQAATPINPLLTEIISRPHVPNGPPRQLSGFSPADFVMDIGKFFGNVFSKSPEKSEFDTQRQIIWEKYAVLVDTVDGLSERNQLSADLLRQYVSALQTLMENYYEYYQRMRNVAGADWTDPRFHDFYDPMEVKLADWQYILSAGMLPDSIANEPTLDPETGRLVYAPKTSLMAGFGDSLPLLLIGGAALFLFSRK